MRYYGHDPLPKISKRTENKYSVIQIHRTFTGLF
jgi:hypothetical protein